MIPPLEGGGGQPDLLSALPAAICGGVSDCGHGVCSSGLCACNYFWVGGNCSTAFEDSVWSAWLVFLACVAIIHVVALLGSAVNLRALCRCARPRVSPSPDAAPPAPSRRSPTLRDFACILGACGSFSRLIWLLDPHGTRDVYPTGVAAFLLRLPQLLWLAAFSIILLSWSYILSSISDATVSYKRLRVVLVLCMIGLGCESLPAAILHAVDGAQIAHNISNVAFCLYAVVLFASGTYTVVKLKGLFRAQANSHRIPRSALQKLNDTVTLTLRSVACCTVLGVLLIVSTAVTSAFAITPHSHPHLYMAYMFLVHLCVEPGLAVTVVYASGLPGAWGALCSRRKSEKDPLGDLLLGSPSPATPSVNHGPSLLLRMDTQDELGRSLSICSRESNDSYRAAESPDPGYEEYAYGVHMTGDWPQ